MASPVQLFATKFSILFQNAWFGIRGYASYFSPLVLYISVTLFLAKQIRA
jgi:hypothetical protein